MGANMDNDNVLGNRKGMCYTVVLMLGRVFGLIALTSHNESHSTADPPFYSSPWLLWSVRGFSMPCDGLGGLP
jgi:hypothetical protein